MSATVGSKGAHYTVNPKGKKTATVGIPGTGISYTKTSSTSGRTEYGTDNFQDNSSFSSPNSQTPDDPDKGKWYQKTSWIIALLILFFPVGLFLMWKYTNWKKPIKVIITALFAFVTISAMTSPKLESMSLSADTSKTYDINQNIKITAEILPSDYDIPDSAFKSSGGKIKISDDFIVFSAPKAGSYKIWLEYGGIKSNTISIKTEDKTAIEKEKAAVAKKKAEEEAKKKAEEEAKKKAEEEAARKAEEERIAAEQAAAKAEEEARIKAEEEAQAAENAASQTVNETTVWLSATGEKYHRIPNCGRMNPNTAREVTLSEAQSWHYEPCKKCF